MPLDALLDVTGKVTYTKGHHQDIPGKPERPVGSRTIQVFGP